MRAKPAAEKSFAFHWGSGVVAEEVQVDSEHHRPTIQLLKFTAGAAKGSTALRFCHYDHHGRFQRSPLIIGEADLPALAKALAGAPELRRILKKLFGG
ncbi:MAG: hypothetical protein ACREFQ_19010 [Stellaceae bacterium]